MIKIQKGFVWLPILFAILVLGIVSYLYVNHVPSIKSEDKKSELFIEQLKGGDCFSVPYDSCEASSLRSKWDCNLTIRSCKEYCIIHAANCLSSVGKEYPETVPALILALENNPNYNTGDGIIHYRSSVATALGEIGDDRAIKSLIEILDSDDKMAGDYTEYMDGSSYPEVIQALGTFGDKSQAALPKLIPLLEIPTEVDLNIRGYKKKACVEAVKAIPLIEKNPKPVLSDMLDISRCEKFPIREPY